MNSPALIHDQMSANGASGDNSLRGTTGNRWQAPARVSLLSVQDFKAPETGGGRHKLPSFFQVSQPNDQRSSSPLVWAGRRVMRDSLTRSPAFDFHATDHLARQSIDPSPATAHQCASFAATNHAAKGFTDAGKTFPRA